MLTQQEKNRMMFLAGIINEIKIHNPNWINFKGEIIDEDDDGWQYIEVSNPIIPEFTSLANYEDGYFKIETYEVNDEEENIQKDMSKVIDLLNKYNIPFDQDEFFIILSDKYLDIE